MKRSSTPHTHIKGTFISLHTHFTQTEVEVSHLGCNFYIPGISRSKVSRRRFNLQNPKRTAGFQPARMPTLAAHIILVALTTIALRREVGIRNSVKITGGFAGAPLNGAIGNSFQVMTANCKKISRYARQDFHLMPESSA